MDITSLAADVLGEWIDGYFHPSDDEPGPSIRVRVACISDDAVLIHVSDVDPYPDEDTARVYKISVTAEEVNIH